jgi:PH (Pleckstrin Homology) domain-containing protein
VTYRARREPILLGVLAVDGVVTLGVAGWLLYLAIARHGSPILYGVVPSLILSFVFAAWMLLRSAYEIEGSDLVIVQGPVRCTIPSGTIAEVFPTGAGAPAWARNKLQVLFVPGTKERITLLDPEDREAFLRGLSETDPGLAFDGQKVARATPI